jgi:single-strand DNA-binding protein
MFHVPWKMNVNKVLLVGRLTKDPEIRSTSGGQSVASLSMATNRFWKDKSGQRQDKTTFHNVVLWGRLAEIAGQYLTKGQEAYIEGRIETRKYTAKDGTTKYITEIIAENMQLGSKPQGGGSGSYNRPAAAPVSSSQSSQPEAQEEIPTINLDEEQEEVKISDVPF